MKQSYYMSFLLIVFQFFGISAQPSFIEYEISEEFFFSDMETGGFDDDGDMDIIGVFDFTSSIRMIELYENQGDSPLEFSSSVLAMTYGSEVEVGDVDNDGDLDIITCDLYASTLDWFRNNGNNNFEKFSIASVNQPNGLEIGDFDNDGRIHFSDKR